MKVKIITFHFVPNQGAVLQCYAMQTVLEKQGHQAGVIDYRPGYHTVRYSGRKNPFVYARWFWRRFEGRRLPGRLLLTARSFARCVYMNIKKTDSGMEAAFRAFTEKHLHLTQKYTSLSQLRKNPPEADAYISGSDQVWNPDLLDRAFDGAYFLDFGPASAAKVAYAVSTGKKLSDKERGALSALCSSLTAVSMREYDEQTAAATGRDVHTCIDPALLLDAGDYAAIESEKSFGEPYIFVYGFETNDDIQQAVNAAVKKHNCRVINGSPNRIRLLEECEKLRQYDPGEFLSLIKNASCVVTNSFHATVFSVLYQKDFITVAHSTRGGRMTQLLGKLGLCCRLWDSSEFDFSGRVDFPSAFEKLQVLRENAMEYLIGAIAGTRGEEIPHHPEEKPEQIRVQSLAEK